MKSTFRGVAMAGVATLLSAGSLWAHPGHVTEGGLWHTVTHALSSPYHVAIVCSVAVLAVAVTLAIRPARPVRCERGDTNEAL